MFLMGRISAQGLNVKQLLPPYLGVEHTPEDLLTGVSFASGATGFDPLTPVIVVIYFVSADLCVCSRSSS